MTEEPAADGPLPARLAAGVVIAMGVAVLAGWSLDVPSLRGPIPGLIEMKANTALAFVLCGMSLWLLADPARSPGRRRVAEACALVAALIGAVSLAEYGLARDLGVDELLFEDRPDAAGDPTVHPGRLAPQSALNFLLLGGGLMALSRSGRRRRWAGETCVLLAGAVAVFAVLGYAYGAGKLERVAAFHPIAPHTAMTFLVLSAGALLARPGGVAGALLGQRAGSVTARRLLPLAVLVLPVLGWLRLEGETAGLFSANTGVALMVLASATLIGAAIVATGHRLNASESAREEATLAHRRLAAIVEHSDDAILSKTLDGTITSWNRGAERLYGYTREEAVGRPVRMLMPEHRVADEAAIGNEVQAGRPVENYDTERVRKDRDIVEVSVTVSPIRDLAGEVVGASAIARDIGERRRQEAAVRLAMEEAERANRAKSEFLSRMSHELRTPLAAILGFGQLLEMDGLEGKQRHCVEHILKGGRHLLDLINELLDVSRIEAGNMVISMEPVRAGEVVHDALALVAPLAAARDVELDTDIEPGDDRYVRADLQRLKQVLLNLLSNAVKYNHEGGNVSVRLDDAPGGRLCLLVRDTGPGVTPDDLARLFQPFERLDAEERGIEGTGMGLALVKGLVEAMGGTVAAESVVGEGTTFRLELAAASRPVATVAAAPGEAAAPEATGAVRRRVLYIEDNVSNVKLMEQLFADRADHELLIAMHGQLGLDLARQHRPDAILLDLHLPDMDGAEVLARLRRDPSTREIPVMILSADAGEGRTSRLLEAGASAYFTKPLDLKRLIQALDALGAPEFVATVGEVASPRVSIRGEQM